MELQDYTTVTSAIVPDGVYALRNAGNTNRWMDIQQNRVDPGAYVQQYAYSQSPAELFDRAGLYKISHNTTTNTYVIRCMLNNLLTFGFDGNKVVTKYIPSDDAMVDIHDTFTITRSGDGYVIKPYGQSYTVSANNTMNSGAAGAPESYLAKRSEAEAGTRAIWLFEKYIGTQRTGVTYSSSPNIQNGLTKGATSTLTLCVWSTYINAQTPYVEMATAYEDTAFCESTSAENQTLITGNIVGKSQVLFRIRYGSGTALTSYQEDFFVTPPINEANEHFMQNVATKKYMDVEGPSTAVGAYIQQWDFSTAPQKKWVFTKQTGGYYTIQSVYSDLYVGVDSSTSTAVKQYSTVNDYTKWYFAETVSGNYVIHNKAQGDWYVLASSSATVANGSDLTMSIYYNDENYRDEWNYNPSNILDTVPTNLRSTSTHLCIPCAITNTAGFWSVNGYDGFNCGTASQQETIARNVQATMLAVAGSCTANNNIPVGFSVFGYTQNGTTYSFESNNYWKRDNAFTFEDIIKEIDAGRPVLVGYSGVVYSGGHMTVCAGYEFVDGELYLHVSDAHQSEYEVILYKDEGDNCYNDFICKVNIVS